MSDDEKALHAAVIDRPNDKTPRLVLADYYDDHGMHEHAAVHRILAENPESLHTAEGADKLLAEHPDHHKLGIAVSEAAHLMTRAANKASADLVGGPNSSQYDTNVSRRNALEYASIAKRYTGENNGLWASINHDRTHRSHDVIYNTHRERSTPGEVMGWPHDHPFLTRHHAPMHAAAEARDYHKAAAMVHEAIDVKKQGYDYRSEPNHE